MIIRFESSGSIHIERKSPKALANRARRDQSSPRNVLPPSSELMSESQLIRIFLSFCWSTRIWLNEYPAFELTSSSAEFIFFHVRPPSSVR